jgi:ferredoxin
MPKKFHLKPKPAASRFVPPGPFGIIEGDGCLNCAKCVKKFCAYSVYQNRRYDARQMADTADSLCKNCFRCVQECYGKVLSKTANPAFWSMGDDYWTPDMIATNQRQAESGKIPVSGGGYGGPFAGPGFDSMWTDMSEIVRPTRDGIHGREYISTAVEFGWVRRSSPIFTGPAGAAGIAPPSRVEISIPFIFDVLPFRDFGSRVRLALARAALEANTLLIVPPEFIRAEAIPAAGHLVPLLPPGSPQEFSSLLAHSRMAEVQFGPGMKEMVGEIKRIKPGILVSVRVPLTPRAEQDLDELEDSGAEVIHFVADGNGRELGSSSPRFIKDAIRNLHLHLVKSNRRDDVTLIFGGGIALAEHVAKAVICGADAVSIDRALLLALECRLCSECREKTCPVEIDKTEPAWGRQRVVNLVAAWHGQLLEVLGAMGLRDVRRLRGEAGRAIFLEEIEKETFGQIFGGRKKAGQAACQPVPKAEECHVLAT